MRNSYSGVGVVHLVFKPGLVYYYSIKMHIKN